jgi:hypothetical protein
LPAPTEELLMNSVAGRRQKLFNFGGVLLMIALTGCGGSGMESEVSGQVKLDGQAVGPGAVVFAPIEGNSNPADGAIQLDGSYFLKTSREVGLNAGTYKVSVSVFDQPEVKPGERSMVPAKLKTPQRYSDIQTSGLEYTVEPGKNEIDIELTSK